MNRRTFLYGGLNWAIALPVLAHAPYPQWNVYRKRHLFILTSKADARAFPTGKAIAQILATHLPESQARVSRAPDTQRIASLISTKQMDAAILAVEEAVAMRLGQSPYASFGGIPLTVLADLGDYVLVCREDFPERHAHLVSETLQHHQDGLESAGIHLTQRSRLPLLPTHPGAIA